MPGLVNAHQHGRGLSQVQLGYPDDRLERWIARRRGRGPLDPYPVTLLAAMQMLRNGVTCAVHANYSYGSGDYEGELRAALQAYMDAGIRATVCVGAADRSALVYPAEREPAFLAGLSEPLRAMLQRPAPPAYAGGPEATVRLMDRLRADCSGHERLRLCYGPAGPQWVSDAMFQAIARDAERHGLGIHFHALESPAQAAACAALFPEGTFEHLDGLGVLGPRTVAAHGVYMTDADLERARARGLTIVTNPSSNLRLSNGPPPLARFRAHGIRVAIGTDNTGFSDGEDLLAELRLADLLARDPAWSGQSRPSAQELIGMATSAGAVAAQWPDEIGRIEPGRRADLTALSLESLRGTYLDADMPVTEALIGRTFGSDVRLTMVEGRILYRDGRFTHLEPDRIHAAAAQAARDARRPAVREDADLVPELLQALDGFYGAGAAQVG